MARNFLWIQTDEQRTDSLCCYGNQQVRTPNIDRIASGGTCFANHHVQSPVCVPSRCCELTSRYPHQLGIFNNNVLFNPDNWPAGTVTFPELFADAGYLTANFGKYHTPPHASWLENWHFEFFKKESDYMNFGSGYDACEHEVLHRGHEQKDIILSGIYPKRTDGRTPANHVTDTAIDWLEAAGYANQPFFLRVSYLAPHTPVLAPESHYHMYDNAPVAWDIPEEVTLADRPAYERGTHGNYYKHTAEEYLRMRRTYWGLVSHIDDQVGRLLQWLEDHEQLDNTVVLYTSDHGDLMGEYGLFQKGFFYDITTRVPMIISGPGIPAGQVVQGLTEQVDLAPTLLHLAGLETTPAMQGKDILLEGTRENVIGEIILGDSRRSWIRTAQWSLDITSEIKDVPVTTAREMDGKLIDLVKDPLAHKNLFYDPEFRTVVEELLKCLKMRMTEGRIPVKHGNLQPKI